MNNEPAAAGCLKRSRIGNGVGSGIDDERDRARDAPQAEVMADTNSSKWRFRLTYRNRFYIM